MNLFWFRRDLRLEDNAGLYHALKEGKETLCVFIFDEEILSKLADPEDARVHFIYKTIVQLHQQISALGSALIVKYGKPLNIIQDLCLEYPIEKVFTNNDYEPYARERDAAVKEYLEAKNIAFFSYKDQVIFEKEEVLNNSGTPYLVFTPYGRKWKEKLNDFYLKSYPSLNYLNHLYKINKQDILSLHAIGFKTSALIFPDSDLPLERLHNYEHIRNLLWSTETSKLGVHLRFGTISIRQLVSYVKEHSAVYLNELIWREFFQMILWHFPEVVTQSFRKEFDHIEWRNNEQEFEAWCHGNTGYPTVDAGMRELNQSGFMHNRARMITASFLCKHLLIDWRWGEQYFAQKLLDYDLAANNGNWQWAAGTGCDAAPYFRIFSPAAQQKKFDPEAKYIRRWVPEYGSPAYPKPMVDHDLARARALEVYKNGLMR